EDDAVSGRVSFVPFDLVVRDDNLFADLPVWTAERTIRAFVGDDSDIAILVHLEAVGPIGIGFAAARHEWGVGLHELLKPRAHVPRLVRHVTKVPRSCWRHEQHGSSDDAEHVCLSQHESAGRSHWGSPDWGYVTLAKFCLRGIAADKPVLHQSADGPAVIA